MMNIFFFFSSRRRHTRSDRDWSSDVCSSDLRTHHSQQRVHPHSQERKEDLPPVGTKKRRSEEHTSELQSRSDLVCRLLLEKKKKKKHTRIPDDMVTQQKRVR